MVYPLDITPNMSQQPKNNSPNQAEKADVVQKTTVENASKHTQYHGQRSVYEGQTNSGTSTSNIPVHQEASNKNKSQSNQAPGAKYFGYSRMDDNNKKMMDVMATKGPAAAADAMMKDCGYSYSEMRARYG
jgi:hypothetical protein